MQRSFPRGVQPAAAGRVDRRPDERAIRGNGCSIKCFGLADEISFRLGLSVQPLHGRCAELGCRGMPRSRMRREGRRIGGTAALVVLTGVVALCVGIANPRLATTVAFLWGVLFAFFFLPRAALALLDRLS